LFEGAAAFYDQGRPPYAPGLADAMAGALGLDGTGRLLDVGCGPGKVALLVAHLFDEVVGLDPDPGMIAEATRLAREQGATNARWVQRRAEELPGDLGDFRVITFAASFHWLDRPKVAAAAHRMLVPGGAAIHVDSSAYRMTYEKLETSEHPPPPHDAIADLRRSYLGPDLRAGQGIRNTSPGNEAEVFGGAGFTGPDTVVVPDGRVLLRTIDDLVANTLSGSGTAPHLFGDRFGDFEADLRALLADASPSGLFAMSLPDTVLIIWRPGPAAA
jgi:SAM-dependent methyltransferase